MVQDIMGKVELKRLKVEAVAAARANGSALLEAALLQAAAASAVVAKHAARNSTGGEHLPDLPEE